MHYLLLKQLPFRLLCRIRYGFSRFAGTGLTRTVAVFALLLCLLAGSIAQANDRVYTQTVRINVKNSGLEKIFMEIRSQTGYDFLYNSRLLKGTTPVTLHIVGASLEEILDEVFKNQPITYSIIEKTIVVKKKTGWRKEDARKKAPAEQKRQPVGFPAGPQANEAWAKRIETSYPQADEVSGKVTDEKGEPLPGVSILVRGTQQGTATDEAGKYTIQVPNQQAVLVFSFVGYVSQEVAVGARKSLDITLQVDEKALEEVVVVGYGTQKKVNLTGAVSQVSTERLENRPINNLDQALQGVSPGLNITTNSVSGGEPNSRMGINIRGIGSLSGGAPWILVDGTPMDINSINPADVESVSILKDAASTAIYGSRAAYGVILITTKTGKGSEKIKTDYSNNLSWAQPTNMPGFVNSLRFARAINEAATNSGQNAIFSDATIERIIKYQNDPENTPSMVADPRDPNGWGYWNQGNANTDWWDVLYKDVVFSQRHNLGISGASKNANYYVGLGWLDDAGKFNFAHEKFQRFNLASNLSLKVSDKLTIFLKTKFNRSYQRYLISQDVNNRFANYNMMAISWPTDPVYTPNGDFALDKNLPGVLQNGGSDKQYTTDLWFSPSLQLNLTRDWKVNADLSYNFYGYKRGHHRAIVWGLATDGVTPIKHYSQNWNRMRQELVHNEYITSNVYTEYAKQFNRHYVNLLLGGQAELSNNMLLNGWRRDLVTESVPSISTAIGAMDLQDNMSHWSTLGTFMRVSYNFDEKYLLELNGRYDGSSRFQKGRRWGFFPSAAVGYNIWKEDFWKPVADVVNTLKFRASYGTLGNQNVANYLHEETIPIVTNLNWIMGSARPVYATVPNNRSLGLTWETSETVNFGIDAEALDNRLGLTLEWYNRTTRNMFGPGETLPASYGASVPLKNNATLSTKGIELSVSWRQTLQSGFGYNVNFIFSDNKTTIRKYNNPTRLISNFYEGQTYGQIWGFETAGLFQSKQEAQEWADQSQLYSVWGAGDVKYQDLNQDGKITRGDQTVANPGDLKVIGNTSPRFLYGLNLGLNYKMFDFTMFWQGVGKRDLWMGNQVFFGFGPAWTATVLQEHSINYWSPENTGGYFARPYLTAENNKNQQVQSRFLQNAAYVRLKNVQLGFNIPAQATRKIGIEKVRVYVSGENVFTFSKIMQSFDPEANVSSTASPLVYPLSRSYSLGLNVSF